jgi:hypothetical protein
MKGNANMLERSPSFGKRLAARSETRYLYAQNLPTIVTLLPRAGLALAVTLVSHS